MPFPRDFWKQVEAASKRPKAPPVRARARARPKFGEMNKTEAAYSSYLDALMAGREILWWKFEGMNLRLAPKTYLRIDFNVVLADGTLEMHEVKGFMEDDALVKLKVAAELFPFRFVIVKAANRQMTQWTFKEI